MSKIIHQTFGKGCHIRIVENKYEATNINYDNELHFAQTTARRQAAERHKKLVDLAVKIAESADGASIQEEIKDLIYKGVPESACVEYAKELKKETAGRINLSPPPKANQFKGAKLSRSRRQLYKMLSARAFCPLKFITLTYKKKPTSFEQAKKDIHLFFTRCSRFHGKEIKWVAIPELGAKKMRFHWHAVVEMPFTDSKVLERKLWRKGFVKVASCKADATNDNLKMVSAYVSKYLSKDANQIEGRSRAFYASKNWRVYENKSVVTPQQLKVIKKKLFGEKATFKPQHLKIWEAQHGSQQKIFYDFFLTDKEEERFWDLLSMVNVTRFSSQRRPGVPNLPELKEKIAMYIPVVREVVKTKNITPEQLGVLSKVFDQVDPYDIELGFSTLFTEFDSATGVPSVANCNSAIWWLNLHSRQLTPHSLNNDFFTGVKFGRADMSHLDKLAHDVLNCYA